MQESHCMSFTLLFASTSKNFGYGDKAMLPWDTLNILSTCHTLKLLSKAQFEVFAWQLRCQGKKKHICTFLKIKGKYLGSHE